MGRPKKDASREATDLRVLKAAEASFGSLGFRNTRLEDIAERAGIRRSSLLYHFGSKDSLYQQVVDRAFDEILGALASALMAEGTYEERLTAVVESLQATAEERKGAVAVILRELVAPDSSRSSHITERLNPLIDGIEAFAKAELKGRKSEDFPVRSAILHLIVFHLVRAAAPSGMEAFLGNPSDTTILAKTLLT